MSRNNNNDAAWIVGIVGVVIVVVILAAIFALYSEGPDPNPPDTESTWLDTKNFESNGSDSLTIVHRYGNNLSVHNSTLVIRDTINGRAGEPYAAINGRHNLTTLGYESGSSLTPNDTITLNRSTLGVEDEINFEIAEVLIEYGNREYYVWDGAEASASFTSDFNGSDSITIVQDASDDFGTDNVTIVVDGAINEVTGEPYAEINGRHNLTSLGYEPRSHLRSIDTITLNRSTLGVEGEINFETADVCIRYTESYTPEKSTTLVYRWQGSKTAKPGPATPE